MHLPNKVRTPRLAVIAAHGGRWLAPWACVMVLSVTAAYAAYQALVTSPSLAPAAAAADVERTTATAPTSAVFVLSLVTIDSASAPITIDCLSRNDLVAADVLVVSLEELPAIARQVCIPAEGGLH
jgi:hypothetical protein